MFIDFCFPEKNEKKFIDIVKKISTKKLVFLYESKKELCYEGYFGKKNKNKPSIITLCPLTKKISKDPLQHYFYKDDKKGTFHAPTKKINQVVFKELAEKEKLLGLPFNVLLDNQEKHIEKLSFVVKLCQKYNVKMFVTSFAHSPYLLRSKYDLMSFASLIGMSKKNIKNSTENISLFLK